MNQTNIYQKIQVIQANFKEGIKKAKENKFQKYKYFDENSILAQLKPHLETEKLLLIFSDETNNPFSFHSEKVEKEWVVKYLKKMMIINAENPEQQLTFNFWACGQNTDLAKAKGSAETYAVKYFLQKFFLIPTSENLDPDRK